MLEAHLPLIDKAGEAGVQILCFQEVFTQPYFCPSQDKRWYGAAEPIPNGHTTNLMCEYAKKYQMVIIVPIYEEAMPGVYYNTAAVIDADGTYLGKKLNPQVFDFYLELKCVDDKTLFKKGNITLIR